MQVPDSASVGQTESTRDGATTLEVGVDIRDQVPQAIDPDLLHTVDIVVTLGREAVVEGITDTQLINWDTDEPSERGIDGIDPMRLVREDITGRVRALHDELLEIPADNI